MEKLQGQLEQIDESLKADKLEPVIKGQADNLRERIQEKAPVGPTGTLKRSVVSKLMPRREGYPTIAIVGIDYKYGHHAYMVEYGTSVRYPKKKKAMYIKAFDQFAKRIEPMPRHPFFRPAVMEMKDTIKSNIRDALEDLVEKAV